MGNRNCIQETKGEHYIEVANKPYTKILLPPKNLTLEVNSPTTSVSSGSQFSVRSSEYDLSEGVVSYGDEIYYFFGQPKKVLHDRDFTKVRSIVKG